MRRAFSVRFIGDDARHALRPWRTSPPFDGLEQELADGAKFDHPLFPLFPLLIGPMPRRSGSGRLNVVACGAKRFDRAFQCARVDHHVVGVIGRDHEHAHRYVRKGSGEVC